MRSRGVLEDVLINFEGIPKGFENNREIILKLSRSIIETLKKQIDGFREIFEGRGREGFECYVKGVREEVLERRINGVDSGNLNGSLFVHVDGGGGGTRHSDGRRAATGKADIGIAAELGSRRWRRIERPLWTAAAGSLHLVSGECLQSPART